MKMSEYEFVGGKNGGDEDRVTEWEVGLPSIDDLTLLSQLLIPPELASAFNISPKPYRTTVEVNYALQTMFSTLRGVNHSTTKGSLFETTDLDLNYRLSKLHFCIYFCVLYFISFFYEVLCREE